MKYTKILALTGVLPLILSIGMITADTMTAAPAEAAKPKTYTKTYYQTFWEVKDKYANKENFKDGEWVKATIVPEVPVKLSITEGSTAKQALAKRCAEIGRPAPKNDWSGVEKEAKDSHSRATKMGKDEWLKYVASINPEDPRMASLWAKNFRDGVPPIEYWIQEEIQPSERQHDIYRICNETEPFSYEIPGDPHHWLYTHGMTDAEIKQAIKNFCKRNICA